MAVFDDAVFLWDPGDAETASSDLVSGVSAAGTTEGSIVTTDGHVGRANVGAVSSNFNTTTIGGTLTPPIATLHPGVSWSTFAVSRIGATGWQEALWLGQTNSSDDYSYIRTRRGTTGESSLRISTGTPGDANWPFVSTPDVGVGGGFVTSIITYQTTGANTATLTAYQNSATAIGSDTADTTFIVNVHRIRIGGLGDQTPSNSTAGETYAAGIWDRVLTAGEIDEILAGPFGYLVVSEAHTVNATFNAGGGLTGVVAGHRVAAGTINGGGGMTGAVTPAHAAAGTLNAGGSITGAVSGVHAATGILRAGGGLTGSVVGGHVTDANFRAGGSLTVALAGAHHTDAEFNCGGGMFAQFLRESGMFQEGALAASSQSGGLAVSAQTGLVTVGTQSGGLKVGRQE